MIYFVLDSVSMPIIYWTGQCWPEQRSLWMKCRFTQIIMLVYFDSNFEMKLANDPHTSIIIIIFFFACISTVSWFLKILSQVFGKLYINLYCYKHTFQSRNIDSLFKQQLDTYDIVSEHFWSYWACGNMWPKMTLVAVAYKICKSILVIKV